MDKKAITLQQLEEALRDLTRWIRDKLGGYLAEPTAEGESGWVLTTNGIGGRSWEPIDGLETDSTLSVEGAAADAAAAGAAIAAAQAAADAPVTTEKLADGAVTGDKLAAEVHGRFSAYNLLDNSDFRNPVNQRGQTSYSEASYSGDEGYTIDRWKARGTPSITLNNGYLTFSATSASSWMFQFIAVPKAGTYTLAASVKCSGVAGVLSFRTNGLSTTLEQVSIPISTDYQTIALTIEVEAIDIVNTLAAVFSGGAGMYLDIEWAALYEGEYTADTLPEYQPKGYAAELMECMRYFRQTFTNGNTTTYDGAVIMPVATATTSCTVNFEIPMRINPTVTVYNPYTGNAGAVGDWVDDAEITGVDVVAYAPNAFRLSKSNGFTKGQTAFFHYSASAELYP